MARGRSSPISAQRGEARMVDVSDKAATERVAVAEGRVVMTTRDARSRAQAATPRRATCSAPRASPASWRPSARTSSSRSAIRCAISKVAVDIDAGSQRCRASCVRATVQGHRPDRRRDGGADRGLGRVPDDLRHGQGGRARHAHRGHPPGREARRQVRPLSRRRSEHGMALLPVADALARVLRRRDAAAGRATCRSPRRTAACWRADLAALRTQPPDDVSAMDGYAVRAADVATRAGDAEGDRRGRGRASVRRHGRRGRGRAHLHRRRGAARRRHDRHPGEHRARRRRVIVDQRRRRAGRHIRARRARFQGRRRAAAARPPPDRPRPRCWPRR